MSIAPPLHPQYIAEGNFDGGGYAFFKLPEHTTYRYVAQQASPQVIDTFAAIGQQQGFVIAPFQASTATPILLIRPDLSLEEALPAPDKLPPLRLYAQDDEEAGRDDYARGFQVCMQRLTATETLRKVVYARPLTLAIAPHSKVDAYSLFLHACHRNPHCYVALWWTPQTGMWLVATPETLLATDDGQPEQWRTMALAGTMAWRGDITPPEQWSEKNRREQACVAHYIRRQLETVVDGLIVHPCHTIRSGELQHLRTDFTFGLRHGISLGALLHRLHPTPAVCGDSLMAARSAIRAAEAFPRRYYAGFSGPIEGTATALFVSLRCMTLCPPLSATLYAGGGLLADSRLEDEWQETCRKMQPMLQLFQSNPQGGFVHRPPFVM
jgi:isochorismate synthase